MTKKIEATILTVFGSCIASLCFFVLTIMYDSIKQADERLTVSHTESMLANQKIQHSNEVIAKEIATLQYLVDSFHERVLTLEDTQFELTQAILPDDIEGESYYEQVEDFDFDNLPPTAAGPEPAQEQRPQVQQNVEQYQQQIQQKLNNYK